MAIDDNYIYVTMWQQNADTKSNILQISRSDIYKYSKLVYDRKAVTNGNEQEAIAIVQQKSNGIKVNIKTITYSGTSNKVIKETNSGDQEFFCKKMIPVTPDNKPFTDEIAGITTYSRTNGTHFFINIRNSSNKGDKSRRIYTRASYDGNVFTVYPEKSFTVLNTALTTPVSGSTTPKTNRCTFQDIFYSGTYGLLIPIWHGSSDANVNPRDNNSNSLLQVSLKDDYKYKEIKKC